MVGGPGGEKLWGQQQFGFAEHGALNSLADLGGIGGVGAGQRDRGLERALQGVVAHITDEQCPAGGQQIHGVVDDLGQISPVGEVLNDRVENDGVEVALRQRLGDVGGLGQQLDPITPPDPQLVERAGQGVDGDRRHVGADIVLTARGDL